MMKSFRKSFGLFAVAGALVVTGAFAPKMAPAVPVEHETRNAVIYEHDNRTATIYEHDNRTALIVEHESRNV